MPNLVTFLHWEPLSGWYAVGCSSKNGYQKDICLQEIGLYAQNVITILSSIINIIRSEGDFNVDH